MSTDRDNIKRCPVCGKFMSIRTSKKRKKKFCSNPCKIIFLALECKITKKGREKISKSKLREKNPNWKGDKVGYSSLHEWIKNRLKRPVKCSNCKKKPKYKIGLDLANVSGKYKRDISDWEWLCRKCHMTKDGRLEKFKQLNK